MLFLQRRFYHTKIILVTSENHHKRWLHTFSCNITTNLSNAPSLGKVRVFCKNSCKLSQYTFIFGQRYSTGRSVELKYLVIGGLSRLKHSKNIYLIKRADMKCNNFPAVIAALTKDQIRHHKVWACLSWSRRVALHSEDSSLFVDELSKNLSRY